MLSYHTDCEIEVPFRDVKMWDKKCVFLSVRYSRRYPN